MTRGWLIIVASACILAGCGGSKPKAKLVVLHCDELAALFRAAEPVFERANPTIDIRAESAAAGPTLRKLTGMGKDCDLIAVSSPDLLRRMLYPKTVRWVAAFATDEIVLAAADRSRYASEIDGDNWYRILLRNDVSFARVDERLDPAGIATSIVWQLADGHYGPWQGKAISGQLRAACKGNSIRPDANTLMTLLQTPSGPDYVFVPRSMAARQRQRLIELPKEINLGHVEMAARYGKAVVELNNGSGTTRRVPGRPFLYAIAVPAGARNAEAAVRFARFLLDNSGRDMMMKSGLRPVVPARIGPDDTVPDRLAPYVQTWE